MVYRADCLNLRDQTISIRLGPEFFPAQFYKSFSGPYFVENPLTMLVTCIIQQLRPLEYSALTKCNK